MRPHHWLSLLKLCLSLTVFARGWLTWKWDSPIRGLLWNELWWSERINWHDFALGSDASITTGLEIFGIGLMLSAAVPWLTSAPKLKWTRWLLIPMAGALFLDSFARFIDSGNQLGMAIEHTLQWGCPLLLFIALRKELISRVWLIAASGGTMLTFVGHGLYAVGFHPVPLNYQIMTASLLGLGEAGVLKFLSTAGYLDFAAALGLAFKPLRRYTLYYLIAWGALTALARVVTGPTLDPWLMETVVRSAHWMIPLLIFLPPNAPLPKDSELS